MNVKCPHCGTEYDVERREFGKYVTCQVCGKGFVAGTTTDFTQKQAGDEARAPSVDDDSVSEKVKNTAKAFANVAYDKVKNVDVKNVAHDVHDKFNKFTGLERLEGFSLKDLFADIFKHHDRNDVEAFFTVGTESTTPPIEAVDTTWPRPWMFFRALSFSAIVYFLFNLAWETFENINLLPGLMAVGTIAVPVSALIFFFEINVRRNVSLFVILRLVMLGGILSLIFSLVLFELPIGDMKFLGASVAGLVEEPGKLIALVAVARSSKHGYKLNGLLMGAAIGAGFAMFESMGYAFRALLVSKGDKDFMTDIILMRGALSPFAHIAWTAIAGAALWRVKGGRDFAAKMLFDGKFWHLFIVSVVLHMVWNADFSFPYHLKSIGLGLLAWIVILALMQEGLREIRHERIESLKDNNENPE